MSRIQNPRWIHRYLWMISLPRFLAVPTDQKKLPSLLKWNLKSKNREFGENVGKTWFIKWKKKSKIGGRLSPSEFSPYYSLTLGETVLSPALAGKFLETVLPKPGGLSGFEGFGGSICTKKFNSDLKISRFSPISQFFRWKTMSILPSNSGTPTPHLFVKQSRGC